MILGAGVAASVGNGIDRHSIDGNPIERRPVLIVTGLVQEARIAAMDEFIKEYEAEHGVISDDDMDEAWRLLRAKAIVVRGRDFP